MKTIAIFPGSFDPPTFGHINVIDRARSIFSELHVVVAINSHKVGLFSTEEKVTMLKELTKQWPNVIVNTWDTLIVDYAKKHNAKVLIRGVRNMEDFSYEFDLSLMNRALNQEVETFLIPTDPKFFVLRSSSIKELAAFGGDVSTMVPPIVEQALKLKQKKIKIF